MKIKAFNVKLPSKGTASLPAWRAVVLFGVLLFCLAGLIARGLHLQTVQDDFLQEQGNARYTRLVSVNAHRGKIMDRHNTPLAISTPMQSVWVSTNNGKIKIKVPENGKPKDKDVPLIELINKEQLSELANLIEMPVAEVQARIADTKRDFAPLKRQLAPDVVEKIKAMNLPGLIMQPEYRRYYPAGEEAAQLLGFTGQDDNGQEGVERLLQKQLAGQPGSQRVIKDRRGHIIDDAGGLRPPRPGADIALSLDLNVQHLAFRELKNAVEHHKAKAGAVVVLDSSTGELLALANYPSFNPNNRNAANPDVVRNRAITDSFEPGSTMKPFTVAIALENGKVKPSSVFDTEHGSIIVGGRRISDSHPKDRLTVEEIIQKSSNVGSAKIALSLDPHVMWQGLSESGFGESTGSKLPGEAHGRLRSPKTWKPIEQATMSYGHGLSVNLLQLARAYTIYANHGELKPVSLLKQDEPVTGRRVFSPQTAQSVLRMLEMVTQPGGTAPTAQVKGYRTAGKTGTAHKLEQGRYVNKYVASFVGVAPASNPRIVVAVMIDEPSAGQYYGGLVAAPVFSAIVSAVLQNLNIPYDAPLNNVIVPPEDIVKEEV